VSAYYASVFYYLKTQNDTEFCELVGHDRWWYRFKTIVINILYIYSYPMDRNVYNNIYEKISNYYSIIQNVKKIKIMILFTTNRILGTGNCSVQTAVRSYGFRRNVRIIQTYTYTRVYVQINNWIIIFICVLRFYLTSCLSLDIAVKPEPCSRTVSRGPNTDVSSRSPKTRLQWLVAFVCNNGPF